jgi:hypothetical protein
MPISTFSPASSSGSPLMDSFTKNHPQHLERQPSPRPRTPVAVVKASAVPDAGRCEIVDFNAFLSEESRSRYPSPLKDLAMRCVSRMSRDTRGFAC